MNDMRMRNRRIAAKYIISIIMLSVGLVVYLLAREPYTRFRDRTRDWMEDALWQTVGSIRTGIAQMRLPDNLRLGGAHTPPSGSGTQLESGVSDAPENAGGGLYFHETFYPYCAMLPDALKLIYNQVYANALSCNRERFTLVSTLSQQELQDVMNAVYNDHPELFWLDTSYAYGYVGEGLVVTLTLTYNAAVENFEQSKAQFEAAAAGIVEAAKQYVDDADKERYVHDRLMDMAVYDEASPMSQSAYSALVLGRSVCAGYARAFQYMMMQLSIPCYYCVGTAAGGDHAWNIVQLNGDCYNVDAAWNDAAGEVLGGYNYTYFNVPDGELSEHVRTGLSGRLPKCA